MITDPWEYHNFTEILETMKGRIAYALDRARSAFSYWGTQEKYTLKSDPWAKKNPEISLEIMEERDLPLEQWTSLGFPLYPLPNQVSTHVDCRVWKEAMDDHAKGAVCHGETELLNKVWKDLTDGCDSMVESPGDLPTHTQNHFEDPGIDIPRILDALATEVKNGRMTGPFPIGFIPNAKVNGFLSIVKPGGARRQVGNLAAPKGVSFNDVISKQSLQEGKVVQTMAKQISIMIANSGTGAILSCSDMVAAYKCLPVKKEQWRIQVFHLLGKEFVDLRLIFGDKRACMLYDRFHHCIIKSFVLPKAPIPFSWLGRTIDDVTTVAPRGGSNLTRNFVASYRKVLAELNIGAAEEDPNKSKAFDGSTSGEVLGTWFDTNTMTWEYPKRKLISLLDLLQSTLHSNKMTLNEVETIHGKLVHLTQLAPPLKLYMGEMVQQLREFLKRYK